MKLILITTMILSLGLLTACGGSSGGSKGGGSDVAPGEPGPSNGGPAEVPKDPEVVNDLESLPSSITEEVKENQLLALTIPEYKNTNSYTFTGVDGDNVELSSGGDQVNFNLEADYETQPVYNFIMTVTNATEQTKDIDVTINVIDVPEDLNSLPSAITESVNENSRFAFAIPEYKDTNSYAFTGVDGDSVKLWAERGEVIFKYAPDYETKYIYNFIMIVTNEMEQTKEIDVTVNINDVTNDFIFEIVEGALGSVRMVVNSPLYATKYDTYSFTVQKNNETPVEYSYLGDTSTHDIPLRSFIGDVQKDGTIIKLADETKRYTVKPIGDDGLPGIRFSGKYGHPEIKIIQWGDNSWKTLGYLFDYVCGYDEDEDEVYESYQEISDHLSLIDDVDLPNLSRVTDMRQAFYLCDFTEDQVYWDVSKVESMSGSFLFGKGNSDISQWDVSSVKDMDNLFNHAYEFSSDISSWDTSSVENMENMFKKTKSFDRNLRGWDVDKVTSYEWFNIDSILRDEYLPCFADTCVIPAP